MYEHSVAVTEQKKKERGAFVKFGLCAALLGLFMWLTWSKLEESRIYYGIYVVLFVLALKASEIYLFLTPRRLYGTVVSLKDFEEKTSIINPGTYAHKVGQYTRTSFSLIVKLDNGKLKCYDYEFKGALKNLKVGDRVAIFRFLKMPVMGE